MTEFKPLEIEDRELFTKYLGDYKFNTYEYSFLTLYLWRKMCNTEFCLMDDALIVRKSNKCFGSYYMQPIGYTEKNLEGIISALKQLKSLSSECKNLFRDVELPFLNKLKETFGESLIFREDTDNFDYIYASSDLISLSGNKYHRKKNQYNQFVNKYRYQVKDLYSEGVALDCIDFSKNWYENKGDSSFQLKYELESIADILTHSDLLNMKGIAVYVDDVLAGFSIGEQVNPEMGVVHIEKGNLEYSGIYSFINKTMIERCFSEVSFINRQEDLGIEGLRKAKAAYNPVRLEKKYIVDFV